MKTILLFTTAFLFLPFFNVQAQLHEEFDYLDINNVKISLSSFGDFARNELDYQSQMPKGSNTFCGFGQGMWINAVNQQNEKLESLNSPPLIRPFNQNFFKGPITNNADFDFIEKYNRVWKINKAEIDYHRLNFSNSNYSIPKDILEWPAHGDENRGEAKNLAPFVDLNGNDFYEPKLGEYPDIRGDQALFTIINDKNGLINKSTTSRLNLEIHIMLYGYSRFDYSFAKNTYFLHYEIYNRSKTNYLKELNIGQVNEVNLGFWNDDFLGTDVDANMTFFYNGDNYDENAYTNRPPAYGLKLLNNPIHSSYNLIYNSSVVDGFPRTAEDRRNTLNGRHKIGSLQEYHSNTFGINESKFAYPGLTDPNMDWNITEEAQGNVPGNRSIVLTTQFKDIAPGDKICLDYAGIFARGPGLNNFEQVDYLKDQATGVQNLYNAANTSCSHPLSVQDPERENNFSSFITDNTLFINCQNIHSQDQNIGLINILGQNVYSNKFSADQSVHAINLNNIKPGPYFVRIQNETIKVIVP